MRWGAGITYGWAVEQDVIYRITMQRVRRVSAIKYARDYATHYETKQVEKFKSIL